MGSTGNLPVPSGNLPDGTKGTHCGQVAAQGPFDCLQVPLGQWPGGGAGRPSTANGEPSHSPVSGNELTAPAQYRIANFEHSQIRPGLWADVQHLLEDAIGRHVGQSLGKDQRH